MEKTDFILHVGLKERICVNAIKTNTDGNTDVFFIYLLGGYGVISGVHCVDETQFTEAFSSDCTQLLIFV